MIKNKSMKTYLVEIPIIRKNFEKTKSAKFKGKIEFICNRHGIIFDWKISFSYLAIDIFTSPSWFDNKNPNFLRREDLFKKLGITQSRRPKGSNNILVLNEEQLRISENYFNSNLKGHYKYSKSNRRSAIKNILTVLKGNNPGGEVKNPKAAEMIIDTNKRYKNFIVLLDDLVDKGKDITLFDSLYSRSIDNKLSFEEFWNINEEMGHFFQLMQKEKNNNSWISYLDSIKVYHKKYNTLLIKAENIAKRARARFSKNVESTKKYPFNFETKDEFQKCHIYEFHDLRDMIIESIKHNLPYEKYEVMIADENNFIPLPEMIHRKFDSNYFTYDINGNIVALTPEGQQFIENKLVGEKNKFKSIPSWFLNEKRQKYLELRNRANNVLI